MVTTHSFCTVTKLNSADVQTAKNQTKRLVDNFKNLKIINYRSLMDYSVSTLTIQHSNNCGHTLSLFVGIIDVGQV